MHALNVEPQSFVASTRAFHRRQRRRRHLRARHPLPVIQTVSVAYIYKLLFRCISPPLKFALVAGSILLACESRCVYAPHPLWFSCVSECCGRQSVHDHGRPAGTS